MWFDFSFRWKSKIIPTLQYLVGNVYLSFLPMNESSGIFSAGNGLPEGLVRSDVRFTDVQAV